MKQKMPEDGSLRIIPARLGRINSSGNPISLLRHSREGGNPVEEE
jgi:hypothetical protein